MSADNQCGPLPVGNDTLQTRGYELLAHLVASADIASREPSYYGTLRLLDAASKLAGLLLECDLNDSWLDGFRIDVDNHKMLLMANQDAYYDYLTEASRQVASRLVDMDLSDSPPAEPQKP